MKYDPSNYFQLNKIKLLNNEEDRIKIAKDLYYRDILDTEEYELLCDEIIKPIL